MREYWSVGIPVLSPGKGAPPTQHLVEMVKHKEYTQYRTFLRVGEAAKLPYYTVLSQAGHKGLLGSGLVVESPCVT